jgi:hypothetical protein
MPEQYNKLAEGIVKGTVPMVASFVERYVAEDEPGFFVGDRERVEGDIRVNVTVFGYLERPNGHMPDSLQLGIVDLQQLPDDRVWMVVGVLPTLPDTEAWLSDLYSAMVRRMAARLVQFGFLDAPNRPRLRAASTLQLTQVAQALRPPKPVPTPQPMPQPAPQPAPQSAPVVEPVKPPVQPELPQAKVQASTPTPAVQAEAPAAQPVTNRVAPSPASLAATPLKPPVPGLSNTASGPQMDIVLTIAMVMIWLVACGMLSYLLVLLLK